MRVTDLARFDDEVLRAVRDLERIVALALGRSGSRAVGVTLDEICIRMFVPEDDAPSRDELRSALTRLERAGKIARMPWDEEQQKWIRPRKPLDSSRTSA